MNPSRLFIERPVATSLLMFAILLSGLLGYHFLAVSALPQVEYPTITVSTSYPGAGPDVMSTSVTAPLETQLGQMPGLDQMTSQSSGGASVITLRFGLDMSMDVAEQEVQAAINNATSLLPTDLPAPPIYAKVNPADTPVLTLGITSKTMPLPEVEDYVNTRLEQKISQISGVGLVTLSGGNRKAYRIQVNIPKLTSYGIAIDTLRTIITTVNVNSPTGTFDGPKRSTSLRIDGQIQSVEQLMNQVIAYQNNGPIRVRDVATVVEGAENSQLAAWSNKTPALILNVQRQPGANVIGVVDNVLRILPQLKQDLPPGIEITPLTDRTTTIRASVEDVEYELGLAMLLVVGVIFVFLRNVPATIIPSLSVPLSLVGTMAAMYLLGFSLDNLSLMSLTIATGFVVDDAIVVIENIARYIEAGEDRYTAALKGAGEIGFTIISLTVSLIAVLIPLLFMKDVVGRLFHEFAMTLSITIVISAIVSITLVPMMCARMLTDTHAPSASHGMWGRLSNATERGINGMIALYGRWLDVVLRFRGLTLLVTLGTIILTGVLAYTIPKGFFPTQDTGVVQGISVMSQAISFEGMKDRQQALGAEILKDPDVASISSFVGIDGQNMTMNVGRFLINLKPRDDRTSDLTTTLQRLGQLGQNVVGTQLFVQPSQDLSLDSSISATQYQFMLENPDYDTFKTWVPRFVAELQKEPSLADVTSDLQAEGLVAQLSLDRATGARYSITPQTVDNLLYDSYGQRQISTIYTQANQYRVILEALPELQNDLTSLSQLYLPGISSEAGGSTSGPTRQPTSGLVPLKQVTTITHSLAPLLISHYGQFPATTISFNVAKGYSLGAATNAIERVEQSIGLPPAFQTAFQGTAAAFRSSLTNEIWLVMAAVIAVYIVLGILYESFIHPITILSTLPSAAIGALIGLYLFGMDLDIMGIIGIVLLIGIVKKNAIMMIDFALEAERLEGHTPLEAIRQAALLRFRPILMTTLAALFGALPLMLSHGVGSELRRPLGVAIVCGLMLSQMLTLFTTPVIYLFMDGIGRRTRTLMQRYHAGRAPSPSPHSNP
ncbi:multidrug resistance efflux pump acriflavin resistance protein [Gluconobacter thailandicus F149-1 = NBRC 100600]|uniref:efflux RND transporter permease subunit n=1 Tax=Gluconobacter thailandicus TaxID=257438 RepID=UPI0002BB0644|nr:efflux RND transporter permease subunit [Gluconobacter thailandicus]KXV52298.1 multidrug transporter [Gluconobacter thailandicus]GAC87575.1 acriflavin resistance protein D [Gluconobacter thailandicus NBRC 3255]GAN92131.1 multidrug resistance efflux pump acriflavin resistance protein [Gluconobacter thailandicus F149-1 = NBRC 100600]GBR60615.1 multidrug efflux pump acriflavin resistance protein AcrB/AcrD/AcrF [Gluconobacter thailandicus F149-1 = NBRC 100600]GEL85962.1 transport system membran